MIHKSLSISLPGHSYPIYIGDGLLQKGGILERHVHGTQVLLVTQKSIAHHYLALLKNQLQHYHCDVFYLPEGEQFKNIHEWQKIFDVLLQKKHERSTTLIALGGGMVGDMTGFAAACYQRGVNYIQVPTTLVAQVDSAIGGKTGINHCLGKNMLGAFYQPQCVISDIRLLSTLTNREFISGLAEVIKYGLITDGPFFDWLENNTQALLNRDSHALLYVVSHNSETKAKIVMLDEKDHEARNLLNFGHTFGHAIETMLTYQHILHGEAVAIGMVMAAELSVELGLLSEEDVKRMIRLLKKCGLLQPLSRPLSIDDFIALLSQDKKVLNQKQHFIVLQKIGEAHKVTHVCKLKIRNAIMRTREKCSI